MVKTISSRDLQTKISATLKTAQGEPVVITKHGNPAAIITGVEGKSWDEVIAILPETSVHQPAKKAARRS